MNNNTIPSSDAPVLSTPTDSPSLIQKLTSWSSSPPVNTHSEITTDAQDGDDTYQTPTTEGNSSGKFMGFLKNISLFKWGAVIIILSFLGFNIFSVLGKATSGITSILKPIASLLGYTVGETTKQAVNMTAKGTKDTVDIAAGAVTSGVNVLENSLTGKKQRNAIDKKTDDKALNHAKKRPKSNNPPEADDAGSRTQLSKGSGKSGFCYIGEDRGFRSCIKVSEDDKCLSGQIFPTKDICINPDLRN